MRLSDYQGFNLDIITKKKYKLLITFFGNQKFRKHEITKNLYLTPNKS